MKDAGTTDLFEIRPDSEIESLSVHGETINRERGRNERRESSGVPKVFLRIARKSILFEPDRGAAIKV